MVVLQGRDVVTVLLSLEGSIWATRQERGADLAVVSRATVAGAVAVLLALAGGLVFFGQAVRQSTELERQSQAAQASERFSRSVDQLGADTIAVRIGAVYSFARLMRDSPGDRRAITEILSGFVRVQAAEALHPQDRRPASPPADVLAALKVLADQPRPRGTDRTGTELPTMLLHGVDFSGLDLRTVVLRDADLTAANLAGADLYRADLTDANLANANLAAANLFLTNLTSANLAKAKLTQATLEYADLEGVELFAANLTGANLREANLSGAHLIGVQLARANLKGADLTNTDLADADLDHTQLADLTCNGTTWPEDFRPPC